MKLLPAERIVWANDVEAALTGATCAVVGAAIDPFGDEIARCMGQGVPTVSLRASTLSLFLGHTGGVAELETARSALQALAYSPARRAAQLERARVVLIERFADSAVMARFEAALEL